MNLTTFFPQTAGHNMRIQGKVVVWVTVGHGTFGHISDSDISFTGAVQIFGSVHNIKLNVSVDSATTGTLDLNGSNYAITYKIDDDGYLVATIPHGPRQGYVMMIAGSGGTYLYPYIDGAKDAWIGP